MTPEYQVYDTIMKRKWETCRGVGNSFGYNSLETEEHYLKPNDIIKMLIDTVSKNGNLLLNLGPMADGTIPDLQKQAILGLGEWLKTVGESIYGTRPWVKAEGETIDGIELRFTQSKDHLYIHIFEMPLIGDIIIESLKIDENSQIEILGMKKKVKWEQNNEDLLIKIPDDLTLTPFLVLKINPKPKIEN